ncbi:ubiquitin-conjugating enzyme E2 N-like [Frankliniella occidentalis]|uniref:Ubiquitin-conjugating enzyme E2 N-like n=1 Tax=Frankliniella occidentalis TaxID=133901 RepID=A0A9C6XU55_FRAOC|nr:ubiquitin-conjugating enzyme E2 N-like [Frankliniella occidentalis]
MSDIRLKRVMSDIKDFQKEETHGIFLTDPDVSDLSCVLVSFWGLEGTEFEGGTFDLKIEIPDKFPFKNPQMFFKTRVWHPNVCQLSGRICMDLLDRNWHSGIVLKECVEAARCLLSLPNPDSPLNAEAANLLEHNEALYWSNARAWTRVHAGAASLTSDLDENISVLMSFDMTAEEALDRGVEHEWDMVSIVKTYDL